MVSALEVKKKVVGYVEKGKGVRNRKRKKKPKYQNVDRETEGWEREGGWL